MKYKRYCRICNRIYDSRINDEDYPNEPWTDCYCSMKCYNIAKEKE